MAHKELKALSDYHLVNPEQDIRGWKVVDEAGATIARVDELLVSTDTELVEVVRLDNGAEYAVKDISLGDRLVYLKGASGPKTGSGEVVKTYHDTRIQRREVGGAERNRGAGLADRTGSSAGPTSVANTGETLAGTAGTTGNTTGTKPILGSTRHEVATSPTVPTGYNEYHNDFLSHYDTTYGAREGSRGSEGFSGYDSAYRYGYSAGIDSRYESRDYDDAEKDIRRDYEREHGSGTWEGVKDAVRFGFDRGRGHIGTRHS